MAAESKVHIKNRMLKKAASLWGVSPNEIESSFDPVVSLLIGACASEIEKISSELNEAQNRITERLIQLMTPESIYGARPAHGVVFAEPVEKTTQITPEHLLYYIKKIKTKNASTELKNIFFSPFQKTKLIDAQVSYLLSGKTKYEINGKIKLPTPIAFDTGVQNLPQSTLYVGLKTEHKEISLKDVTFYFELLDVQDSDLFYHHLKTASFYLGDQKLETIPGYYNTQKSDTILLDSIFDHKPNKTRNIEEHIKKVYQRYFVTVKSDAKITPSVTENDLYNFLMDKEKQNFDDVVWMKIVFSRVVNSDILENVFCTVNAFPALNRKWESITYNLKTYINIVPIHTRELFLDVKSIENTSGQSYALRESNTLKEQKGTYVFRNDSVGKLDSRKAREYLLHLIELLKDESASFSVIGSDFLQSNINELNQSISLLEKKVQDMKYSSSETNYISIAPYNKKETLLVSYWTTDGQEANQIKAGTQLHSYQGNDLKHNGGLFLTTTFEGKNNLEMEERLYAYRRALLSRGRIVTKEDIRALCLEIGGNKVKDILVKKGYTKTIEENKGLVPCIKVCLIANEEVPTEFIEWESIRINIMSILEQQSLNVFPYEVYIKREEVQ